MMPRWYFDTVHLPTNNFFDVFGILDDLDRKIVFFCCIGPENTNFRTIWIHIWWIRRFELCKSYLVINKTIIRLYEPTPRYFFNMNNAFNEYVYHYFGPFSIEIFTNLDRAIL